MQIDEPDGLGFLMLRYLLEPNMQDGDREKRPTICDLSPRFGTACFLQVRRYYHSAPALS